MTHAKVTRSRRMDALQTDKMFLSEEMSSLIPQIRATYPRHFEFAERLNEEANRLLFTATVNKSDRQSVLLAALLPRLLTAFQATVIVAERGMLSEVRLLVRKVLDVTFRIVAIASDDEAALLYILSNEPRRLKSFNKLRMLSESARPPDALRPEVEAIGKEVKRRIEEEDIKAPKTEWFAQRAGLHDHYNREYSVLSESVHANASDADSVLETNDAGEITRLRYEVETEEVDKLLLIACDMVLKSLEAAFKVLSPLAALRAEFNEQLKFSEDDA